MPLNLDDLSPDPLSDRPDPTPDARRLVEDCDTLLDNARATWAWDTVASIRQTVRNCGYVTEGQRQAIDNIQAAVTRQEEAGEDKRTRGGSRRYEGFGGNRRGSGW